MRALWCLPILLSACAIGGGDRVWEFEDADALLVELGNGSVVVESTNTSTIRVDWSGGGVWDAAFPEVWRDTDLVYFDAGGVLGGGEIYVELPYGTGLGAWVDHGEVDVTLDARADLVACVDAGEVWLDIPAGPWATDLSAPIGSMDVSGIENDPESPWRLTSRVIAGSLTVRGSDPLPIR